MRTTNVMKQKNYAAATNTSELEAYRFELLEKLPSFLGKVTGEYCNFISTQNSNDVKSFAAYQAACRAALAHLQLLIRIAAWVQPSMEGIVSIDDDSELDQLIFDARTAIQDRARTKC